MKWMLFCVLAILLSQRAVAQFSKDSLYAEYVTYREQKAFDVFLHDTAITQAFNMPLDSNNEYGYETACLSASQFMVKTKDVENGIETIISNYDSIQYSTKLAFFEAIFGLYPNVYARQVKKLLERETQPKLFAIEAAYLLEADHSPQNKMYLLSMLDDRFGDISTKDLLLQLHDYITSHGKYVAGHTPDITGLFRNQGRLQQKIIYSFQRWNRDYPGLAILQNADGSFARDKEGKLLVFRQLGRSASNMPYFITDGNTPQGIYSITGVQRSTNHFLGPTPTIQMVMPFEDDQAYWGDTYDNSKDALANYLALWPPAWQNYPPATEAFYAGKVGRSAIICHGTTLSPGYFAGKPYYPISPTLGCLCAKEIWNTTTGRLETSEQLRLVNAFTATPGNFGYVIVVNLDNKQEPVEREELEALVNKYEVRK